MASLQFALLHSYGTPIRAFLAKLTEMLGLENGEIERAYEQTKADIYDTLPEDVDAQVKEVARRCAVIALAGELATEWGIVPWKVDDATDAAEPVLQRWISRRGGTGSSEESQHVKLVRDYLSEFGGSRFVALDFAQLEGTAGRWVERHPGRLIISRLAGGVRTALKARNSCLIARAGKRCAPLLRLTRERWQRRFLR